MEAMKAIFISDLHLNPTRPNVTEAFFRFLETCANRTETLYILGDLFEAWIGDDDPSPFADSVRSALSKLTASGTELFIMHGNRDFLIGHKFATETGAKLLGDYASVDFGKCRAVLCHGDTLCTDDTEYIRFRRKIRHPIYLFCLRHLPLRYRLRLANRWREKSMRANSNKPSQIMDVNNMAVEELMASYPGHTLIHGHTHRPATHELSVLGQPAQRLVLGDWDKELWWIETEGGDFQLLSESIG
jgi:UDP-2,3-diacylglucosamine hydrolase